MGASQRHPRRTAMEKQLKRGNHVVLRGTTYYYNRRIPLDVLDQYRPQSKFYESLATSELREANRKAALRTTELDAEFERKRALRQPPRDILSASDIKAIVDHWASEQLADDDWKRTLGMYKAEEGGSL